VVLLPLLRERLAPHRRALLAVALLQLAQTLVTLYLPTLNAAIIDDGVAKGDTARIVRLGAVMIAVAFVQVACAAGAVYFGARVSAALGRDLRADLFARVQSLSSRQIGRYGAASLITRTTNDTTQIQSLVLLAATVVVTAPIMGVGGVALALTQTAALSWLVAVMILVVGAVIVLIVARMRGLFRTLQGRVDQVNRVLREQITGVRVVRAFARDEHERRRFAAANAELTGVSLAAARLTALLVPAVMLVVNVAGAGVVWFGGGLIGAGAMQVGELTAFLSYLVQILMSVLMATFMFMLLPRAEACAERVREVLGAEPELRPPPAPVTAFRAPGLLELRGVELRRPGAEEPVLSGIDLLVRPGEVVGVVGATGTGKSTLLSLVPRLLDVTAGAVLVGGVDVRELDPALLASAVALVPQRPYLFGGTIAANLRFARPDATDDELWRALECAAARDVVERLDDGLETVLGQGGAGLSGGQRQRLAIARALLLRPAVYLFDDCYSALDGETAARLRRSLREATRDAAVLFAAHRAASFGPADRVLTLGAA
jgi:ATP-binding cassette subfamily B multidrug efflux pump